MQSLIVFSQYRWDFALRRPQHVMTRLDRDYRVFYFEEPVYDPRGAWLEILVPAPNVYVCRPHTRIPEKGFADAQLPLLAELLENLISSHDLGTPVVWLYTPMALPLLQRIDAKAVVYDCIEEPVLTDPVARERAQREHSLLRLADLVFAGGPSLFRLKQPLHDNVHCVPSSVDKQHFAQAATAIDHPEQSGLGHPRLGYFGVIDARFDPVTLALLADVHPEWEIVLVGPVLDIDPATLPRRPNIHYMGERPYDELPQFLAGWDLCLLPFVPGPMTRHASPTKILEYMAAGKNIVTTALPDVIEPYGHIVHIARHSQAFVSACERALAEAPPQREKRAAMMRNVVKATSWDHATERMRAELDRLGLRQQKRRMPNPPPQVPERRRAVVIGAGPAGLSAAWHLGDATLLIEQHERVGGSCRSFDVQGFTFDHGGEDLASDDGYVQEMTAMLSGGGSGPGRVRSLQSVMEGFLPQLRGELRLNARVARVSASRRTVVLADGRGYQYGQLVSTMPLPALVDLLGEEAPARVRRAAAELQHESARWVFIGVAPAAALRIPGDGTFDEGLVRRICVPRSGVLACEVRYSRREPLPSDGDALIDRCIVECLQLGILEPEAQIVARYQFDLPFARVDADPAREEAAEIVRQWLRSRDIELAGEFAEWRAGALHPFLAGKQAAERLEDAWTQRMAVPPVPQVPQARFAATEDAGVG